MAKRGHDVHLFGLKWWSGNDTMSHHGVTLHGLADPPRLYNDGRRSVSEALFFASILLARFPMDRFEVTDCAQSPIFHCYSSAFLARMTRTRLVFTWHEYWEAYWEEYLGKLGIVGRVMESGVPHLGFPFVTGTFRTRKRLMSRGVPEKDIFVVPDGVDFHRIQSIPGANGGADVIFVGRLVSTKHVDALLRAIVYVKKRLPGVRLEVIGDGPNRASLEALSEGLGLSDNVRFLGNIPSHDQVISIMKSAKLLVYPILAVGGSGITAIEANACGLPVVMSNDEYGSPEVVRNGLNGLVADAPSPLSLAASILSVLNDEALRGKLSKGAVDFARTRDWKEISASLEDVYSRL